MTAQTSDTARLKLLCIGEAMAELRRDTQGGFDVSFAGDCFNTAIYAARLFNAPKAVGFASLIGHDPLSSGLFELATAEGLYTGCLERHQTKNIGVYAVATDPQGERSFHYWRNQSAARHIGEDAGFLDRLPRAEIIYISAITMAILAVPADRPSSAFFRHARKKGA